MKKVVGVAACIVACMAAFGAAPKAKVDADGLRAEIARLKAQYEAEKKPLGIADEAGVYVLTEEGRKLEELETRLRKLTGEPPAKATRTAMMSGWGLEPLGEPGTLKLPTEFRNKPSLGKAPKRAPGLKLFGGGVKARIFVETSNKSVRALAEEFTAVLPSVASGAYVPEYLRLCGTGKEKAEQALVGNAGKK